MGHKRGRGSSDVSNYFLRSSFKLLKKLAEGETKERRKLEYYDASTNKSWENCERETESKSLTRVWNFSK